MMLARKSNLELCHSCGGTGRWEDGERCVVCDGGLWSPVVGDLGRTRTHDKRPYLWNPGLRKLWVWRGKVKTGYAVREVAIDQNPGERPSRGWQLTKDDGTVYHCRTGGDWHTCDCKGGESGVAAKANSRAAERGERQFLTFGCVHADCLLELLHGGFLDYPEAKG